MPMREFRDAAGTLWRVWSTVPARGMLLSPELEHGWLTFESSEERRRLAPVPADWDRASPKELERLCRRAHQVKRTR